MKFQWVLSWLHYCSNVAQQKLTKLCTMSGRLLGWYTVYTFSGLLPCYGILPGAKFTLHPSLALSYIGCIIAWHSSSKRQPNFASLRRGRHLYSPGRPSRWALAHILVMGCFLLVFGYLHVMCIITAHCALLRSLLWSPYVIGQTIIFSSCSFFLLFFPRLISAVGDWMSTILRHMVWP